jgi:hypothetical protein
MEKVIGLQSSIRKEGIIQVIICFVSQTRNKSIASDLTTLPHEP